MPYAIGYVIYGVPITSEVAKFLEEKLGDLEAEYDLGRLTEAEEEAYDEKGPLSLLGFQTVYSQGDTAGYCGIELATFDECSNVLTLEELDVKPTEEQKAGALRRTESLSQELLDICEPIGRYIVWGSS